MTEKRIKLRWFALLLSIATILFAACWKQDGVEKKPVVVVSIVPESYFVKRIAGDSVDVKVMIPSGANHEMYEPTMDQIISLSEASVYVKVGHSNFAFEKAWINRLLSRQPGIKVVNGSAGCELLPEDPHVWLSVKCAGSMARNIAAALIEEIPTQKKLFESNLGEFQGELNSLELELKKMFASVAKRRFYVFHPAWTYFAEEFGLEQVALEHGHKEPDTHHIEETISLARSDGAKTIFVQPQMSKNSAELVAREIGGRVVVIDPLAENWMEGTKKSALAIREALSQ